jgi:hypothetical protein
MSDRPFSITASCPAGFGGFWMNVSGEFSGLIGADGRDYNMAGLTRLAGDHSSAVMFDAGRKLVGIRRVKATAKLTFSANAANTTSQPPTVYTPQSDFNTQDMVQPDIYVGSKAATYITSISMSPDGGVVEEEQNFNTTPSPPTDPSQASSTVVVVVASVIGFVAVWMRGQRAATRAQPPPSSR